jgi:amino acid transporter
MNKRVIQLIPSIILYVFAVLLVVYAIWAYRYCADIISQARAAGQLATSGNEYDIASFYMGNSGQYFIYALLLAAVGLILHKKQPTLINQIPSDNLTVKKVYDEELDEWFNQIESTENNR